LRIKIRDTSISKINDPVTVIDALVSLVCSKFDSVSNHTTEARTILGSNYLGTESSGNAFSGLEIFSGKSESLSRVVGDRIEFRANQENKGIDNGNWVIDFRNRGVSYFYPQKGRDAEDMFLGHMYSRITNVYVQDINLRNGQSLHDILHLLSSIAGHITFGGFSDDTYRAIKDTYNNLRDKGYG
jgi:hypothetical protein